MALSGITLAGFGHLPVRPAAARRRAPNSIFAAQCDDVLDGPIAGRSGARMLDAGSGHQGWPLPGVSYVAFRPTPGLSPLVNSTRAASRAR
jgi:hypothetical protein